jgi:hypothetical protein
LALSKFVAEFDPHEKHYDCSSNFFHARNKYPRFALENTGHPSPDRTINILENFSEIRNTLDLTSLSENKHEAPCFPHFGDGNSAMGGLSSFFAVSKTEYGKRAGMVMSCHHWVQQRVCRQSHDTEGNSRHCSQCGR